MRASAFGRHRASSVVVAAVAVAVGGSASARADVDGSGARGGPDGGGIDTPAPVITAGPADAASCRGGETGFVVAAGGFGPLTYRWMVACSSDPAAPFVPVLEGVNHGPDGSAAFVAAGTGEPSLRVRPPDAPKAGAPAAWRGPVRFMAAVAGPGGGAVSGAAAWTNCVADYTCSSGLTVLDIFAYLADWFAASPSAEFDGAGGVDLLDLLAFLSAWFAGC